MAFGVDYVSGPSPAALVIQKVTFACRYTGYFSGYNLNNIATTQGKVLTPGEAKALGQVGIALVSNYEWYANRALEGHNSGAWDAQVAQKIHAGCGGPSNKPIYFSVDFQATAAQMTEIIDYFHGIASVIGLERTGAYGSYLVIKALFDAGAIRYGWQTYGWSGGQWDPRANIRQYLNNMTISGHSVDYNESMKADFGQWLYGEEEPMLQITDPLVENYFKEQDANHWLCTHNNYVIQDGNLTLYRSVKSGGTPDLAGLTLFGLPTSNEQPIDSNGNTEQNFERLTVRFDPTHEYDNPPGSGASYVTHLKSAAPASTPVTIDTSAVKADLVQIATDEAKAATDLGKL